MNLIKTKKELCSMLSEILTSAPNLTLDELVSGTNNVYQAANNALIVFIDHIIKKYDPTLYTMQREILIKNIHNLQKYEFKSAYKSFEKIKANETGLKRYIVTYKDKNGLTCYDSFSGGYGMHWSNDTEDVKIYIDKDSALYAAKHTFTSEEKEIIEI